MEIKKVSEYGNGAKIVVIPRNSNIKAGDYVKIIKIPSEDIKDNSKINSKNSESSETSFEDFE